MNATTGPFADADVPAFLALGGEMGRLTRTFDWSQTPVGPVSAWPQSLRFSVSIMLGCDYPLLIWWGKELIHFYNDAYIPVLGKRHPAALGRPGPQVWSELWPAVGTQADVVMSEGRSCRNEGLLVALTRNGCPEEAYLTFSYGPILEDDGRIGGVFCACTEETQRVLGRRRLRTLRGLAARACQAKTAEEACEIAAAELAGNPHDVPFSLLYLLEENGRKAEIAGASGLVINARAAPAGIRVEGGDGPWPFREVGDKGEAVLVDDLPERFGALTGGPWPEPSKSAFVLPLAAADECRPSGFLVAGISPRLPLDDGYRDFFHLVAGQVTNAVSHARACEVECKRAEALAENDRARTRFFADLSHEFRTPLALMLGPIEEALSTPGRILGGTDLETVHRNSLRLLKLVNTLLDFSRIEAGRIEANYQPVDLSSITRDLASSFRSAMEKAGLELILNCPPLDKPVYVDREMWEKIVMNLLSNAFKFTLEGSVEVKLRRANGEAVLSVRDTGTGIAEGELPHVFERFHRVKGVRGRTPEGTGIGLALVHELVKLHGGVVTVESRIGKGSTFKVSVPLGCDHLPEEKIGRARTLQSTSAGTTPSVEEVLRWATGDERALASFEPISWSLEVAGTGEDRTRAAQILVVDDDPDMLWYLSRILGERYEVQTTRNGEEALTAALENPPDLILADVMMPGLDGLGLLRAIREHEKTRTVPVILLSARAGEESKVEGMESGADDYLIKPFSARELQVRIESHLKLACVRKESEEALRKSRDELERRVQERTRALEARAKQLRALTAELTLAEQRERQRLAEVLHDHLQQLLVGARIHSEVLSTRLETQSKDIAENVRDLIDQSIKVSRSLTAELSPTILQQGSLFAALKWLARWIRETHNMSVVLEGEPASDPRREDIMLFLFHAVRELLLNAAKHAGAPSACVEMRQDGNERLCIAVTDPGVGFEPETVWEKAKEGTGFGLFSIRERLTLLGGELKISSSPGKGSSFTLFVPSETRREGHKKGIQRVFAGFMPSKVMESIRILLVDDHTVVRQGLSTMLGRYPDIEIVGQAADGEAAVRMAKKLKPDVILMDISMPGMNGIEATRIIHSELPYIRIIGLSMHDKQDHAARMIEAGASAYCTKDGETAKLLSVIRGG